ncbi:NAD(P)-binding protein [Xylaria sp. FL0043]|nr:NAD(P)-binding protein [Xylaria sp. FL0043]
MSQKKVFLTTGCSPGFGRALDQECLDASHRVIATSRHFSSLPFSNTHEHNHLAVDVDVCSQNTISAASSLSSAAFGQIDVIVNSAGYGLCSAFEEHTDDEIQSVMDIKFMEVARVTRAAIRIMPDVNMPPGGLIQQITALSAYCASKWVVEGMAEPIPKETKPDWNIKLTCIEPGGFRTEWAHKNMSFGQRAQALLAYHHIQAEQVMDAICLLGSKAFAAMEGKLSHYSETYRYFESIGYQST